MRLAQGNDVMRRCLSLGAGAILLVEACARPSSDPSRRPAAPSVEAAMPDASPSPAVAACSSDGWCAEELPLTRGRLPTTIFLPADGSTWIGGTGGALLRRDVTGGWKDFSGAVGDAVVDAIHVDAGGIWVAAGDLWFSQDGKSFERIILRLPDDPPDSDPLEPKLLWGEGGRPHVLAFRADQYLFVPTGKSWKAVAIQHGARVNTLAGTSPADLWVGGEERILMHWDGKKLAEGILAGGEGDDWRSHESGPFDEPDDMVWSEGVQSISHGVAAMNHGIRRRNPAGQWRPWNDVPRECGGAMIVSGASDRDLWLAGPRSVCHYDGKSFRTVALPARTFIDGFASGPGGSWAIDFRSTRAVRKLPEK